MDHVNNFMPHGVCISWDVPLLIMHVFSDIFIAIAYFSIPLGIIYFVKQKDDVTFKPVYYLFAGFITMCGITHLMGIVTLWIPLYYLEGVLKAITAGVSVATAIYLIPKLPGMVALPDLNELLGLNKQLNDENKSRRQAETALQQSKSLLAESNKMLSTVLDAIPVRVFWKDRDSVFMGGNELFLQDAGLSNVMQLQGRTDFDMPWKGSYAEKFRQDDALVMQTGQPQLQIEEQVKDANGNEIWVTTNKVPLTNENDEVIGVLGTYENISAMKLAAQELLEAKELAEEANQAKSEFLANMSHELRTPLNGVIGTMNLLNETELNTRQSNLVGISKHSAESLLGLLNDILDLSKIESGKLQLNSEHVNINDLLTEIAKAMAGRAEEKGLELLCPAHFVPSCVAAVDRLRLKQILMNLIGNAIKFTDKGSIAVDLATISKNNEQVTLRFSVSDTGIGISETQQKKLFERFSQVDSSTTRAQSGSGLGLAISRQLVELMGGRIGVNSTEGVGSTFWFDVTLDVTRYERMSHTDSRLLSTLHVIVMTEQSCYKRYFEDVLSHWHVSYHQANNGHELVQFMQNYAQSGETFITVMDMDFFLRTDIDKLIKQIALQPQFILMASQVQMLRVPDAVKQYDCLVISKPLVQSELFNALLGYVSEMPQLTARDISAKTAQQDLIDARVLLVEDNQINVVVAKGLIEMHGPSVEVAEHGEVALHMLKKHRYDLVFMDCQMPVMDGYECTRQIREDSSGLFDTNIPIVAMTANAMRGDREKCLDAGMDDYMAKPVESDLIYKALKTWIKKEETVAVDGEQISAVITSPAGLVTFDAEVFSQRLMNDLLLQQQVAKNFIADMPKQLASLHSAVTEEDPELIASLAHKLKGAAANMAAEQMRDIAMQLELAAKQGQLDEADTMTEALKMAFEQLKLELIRALDLNHGENDTEA